MNKEDVLARVSEQDILAKYLGPVKIGKMIRSPLRRENTASFHIINSRGKLMFKDFGSGESGDCFKLIMLMFRTDFAGALKIIQEDFNLSGKMRIPIKRNTNFYSIIPKPSNESRSEFEFEEKPFTIEELQYWKQFGITQKILEEYSVVSVQKVKEAKWRDPIISTPNCPIFAYKFPSGRIRFYRPLSFNRSRKFFGNSNNDDIFGYTQAHTKFHEKNQALDKICICAGQKDAMTLYANTSIRSISLNSESAILTREVYDQLVYIAYEVLVCYDMDKTGRANTVRLQKEYGIKDIMPDYPVQNIEKDISDVFKRLNAQKQILIEKT